MAPTFPYTYISCPCSDPSRRIRSDPRALEEEDEDDERTFDPHDPRSNYSLFPPEHLLYCEECHDIKCPRCITEEIVCWYCPNCLFETPSSMVRSEGNRCARNCFNCPVCTAPLTVQSIGNASSKEGYYVLNCNYCMWTSLDRGIKFDKPTNIRAQLDKIIKGGISKSADPAEVPRKSSLARELAPSGVEEEPAAEDMTNPAAQFAALKAFYKQQLTSSIGGDASSPYDSFSSPSALTRIMSLYTSSGSSLRRPKTKPPLMREALFSSEGHQPGYTFTSPPALQNQIESDLDFYSLPTSEQLQGQYPISANGDPYARSINSLNPMPTLLRTKRSKRCQTCKHILVKPEFKPQSTRFRIRLIALAYLPLISLRQLSPPPAITHPLMPEPTVLQPGTTSQFILRLTNHLFEPVRVALGVPGTTIARKGKLGHRVTILCPSFEIGANSDVWDDALATAPITASSTGTGSEKILGGMGSGTMEAGKVYERGRNWVGVGVEIVCSHVPKEADILQEDQDEEDDTIEIPMRVRLEWRQTDGEDSTGHSTKPRSGSVTSPTIAARQRSGSNKNRQLGGDEDDDPLRRELAYWMVVGVGKVARY